MLKKMQKLAAFADTQEELENELNVLMDDDPDGFVSAVAKMLFDGDDDDTGEDD